MDGTNSATPDPDDQITVVSGLPRSGTSLMMQVLEASGMSMLCDSERGPDSFNPRGYYELAAVKATARDASWVAHAPGHAVKVIHALIPLLPRDRSYRVILMLRDLHEVIASQAQMLAARGQPSGGLPNTRLAEIFAAQLDETRQTLAQDPCFEWIEVQHAHLIDDPRNVVLEVSRFLYLSDPANSETLSQIDAMSAVVDADLVHTPKTTSLLDPTK